MLPRSEKSKVMGVNNMKILIAEDNRDIALQSNEYPPHWNLDHHLNLEVGLSWVHIWSHLHSKVC